MMQTRHRVPWLLAALVIGALAGPSASSAAVGSLPEAGRCVRVANGAGVYRGGNCVVRETGAIGKFEWVPVTSTEKQTFTGAGGEVVLPTVGHSTLKCVVANLKGEYTGPKTATVEIEFQGCTNSSDQQCQTTPATKTLVTTLPLEAELGFIKNQPPSVVVGFDLKPKPPLTALAVYECASITETARIEGSVIAQVKPLNRMTTVSNLLFRVTKKGVQVPEAFEGAAKDTLSTTFQSGLESSSGASTLSMLGETGTNANPLEIKSKES